jgi:hypothetical protein
MPHQFETASDEDNDNTATETELLKAVAGEGPMMERDPELRDSAKARMEARRQARASILERKKAREEHIQETVNNSH